MLYGNQLEVEMYNQGLINNKLKQKKNRRKKFNCVKCGEPMIRVDNTNVMACSACKNYFIFDK